MNITMKPVKSSNIASVGYDPEQNEMHVEFSNGTKYAYYDVTSDAHQALVNADSVGSHFGKHIRLKYPSARID